MVISLHDETVLFMDPFGHNEMNVACAFASNWEIFCQKWNSETKNAPFPTSYSCISKEHQLQNDGRSCGIHTLTLCKRYLQGGNLMEYDVQEEGAVIAAEIISNSSSLISVCTKCGCNVPVDTGVKCNGKCRPARIFHRRCLGSVSVSKFKCQICDPKSLESYCQMCSKKPRDSDDRMLCTAGCLMFIHPRCLPPGLSAWRCGICTVR